MPARIKSDDEVIVIGGKDRGKRGKVLRVDTKGQRVYVEGLNIVKRLQPGAHVSIDGPYGDFLLPEKGPSTVAFLAGDTGIAPIRSAGAGFSPAPVRVSFRA